MNAWLAFLTVCVAGGIGAVARYGLQRALPEGGTGIPRAVLTVNLAGSLISGVALALMLGGVLNATLATIVISGLCGGLTTFSTFAVETMELFRVNASKSAYLNIVISVVGGIVLAVVGFVVTRSLL